MTSSRLPEGGRIDRSKPIRFKFDGRSYEGFEGDTLASALLANDVAILGRSFKRRRPRGLLSLGMEEPNAILTLGDGAAAAPNRMAPDVRLTPGLEAHPTKGWPSVRFDFGRIFDAWPAPLSAGFYYKTFMGPALPGRDAWNRLWEPILRGMAGQGTPPSGADSDRYEHQNLTVDVAVVGAGVAGLAAAAAARRAGETVAIFERDFAAGGRTLAMAADGEIDRLAPAQWAERTWAALAADANVTAKLNTTAFGLYDDGFLACYEQCVGEPVSGRIWHVRAGRVVIAAGALERPMTFPGNDRPGVMLSGAVEAAIRRFAVKPGLRAVVYANHAGTDGLDAALGEAGVEVAARIGPGETVTGTSGPGRLAGVDIAPLGEDGLPEMTARRRIAADLLVTSGGFSPALSLHLIAGGRQAWDADKGCFIGIQAGPPGVTLAGAANACFSLKDAVADGWRAGGGGAAPDVSGGASSPTGQGLPIAPMSPGAGKHAFVDFQHDVTASDIGLAAREGFVAIEHAKRFTTSGMGTDQGRTAQLATAALLAEATGQDVGAVGLSGLRPPTTPVPFGALGGQRRDRLFTPIRKTPMHDAHVARGAVFEDVGDWKRARYYPAAGEDMGQATKRECKAVRETVGVLDVSTLGKIHVAGPDAAEFLNRLYTNRMDNLKPGACRYGLMLKDDGMVFDDGVVSRVAEDAFHVTTTSGGAGAVLDWMEDWRQTEWPDLRVWLTSVTEQWAGVALAGPDARRVADEIVPGADLSAEALPHMRWLEAEAFGAAARVFRVSFSGELGFEINVPWRLGSDLWSAALEAGARPYGTEAMHILRAEKGFIVVGHETDGTVTPVDLGMQWILSKKKGDFVGRRALERPALTASGRKQLVGLEPLDPNIVLDEGAQLIGREAPRPPEPMLGHVTSSYWSEARGRGFAMALLKDGASRHGDQVFAWSLGVAHAVRVRDVDFYDPEGARLNG